MRSFFRIFIAFCVLFLLAIPAWGESYEYTVIFHAGNQGTFLPGQEPDVESSTASIRVSPAEIQITNLRYGDRIYFRTADSIRTKNGDKYCCKGIRLSGRDNEETAPESFSVKEDLEFTAVYGIRREPVAYTLQFQDQSGNTLRPSRICYGAEGEKPAAACLYIAGYRPQSYNLTKTLRKSPNENVFTFLYTPIPQTENRVRSSPAAAAPQTPESAEIPEMLDLDEIQIPETTVSGHHFPITALTLLSAAGIGICILRVRKNGKNCRRHA